MADGVQFALDTMYCAGKWCMCDCGSNARLVNVKDDATGLYPSECEVCGKTWMKRDAEFATEAAKLLAEEAEKVKEYEEKKQKVEKEKKRSDYPKVVCWCTECSSCSSASRSMQHYAVGT